MRESGQNRRSLRWLRKLHLHTAHSSERVKQSAWYLADNAENADADADIHHRSAEAQAEPQTGPAKTDGRQREMLQAAIRATTTKASQFFCTKHKKISWQLQGTGLASGSGDWVWGWGWGLLCAWQRHWHKSLDRKRCEPCCAHNNFYVAIKRRLLPRRFVCPFGFCLCIPWLGTRPLQIEIEIS